ncbi:hypothetical protein MTO96_050133, partial [Rhipicephalus appendiculatus]
KQRTHSLLHVVEAASSPYFWISPIALFDDWNYPSTHYNQPPTTAHGRFFLLNELFPTKVAETLTLTTSSSRSRRPDAGAAAATTAAPRRDAGATQLHLTLAR